MSEVTIMKELMILAVGLSAVLPLRAQLFTPESFGGAAVGGIIGAVAGGRHAGTGAAIGAGSGFLLGSLIPASRREPYLYYGPDGPAYYGAPYYPYPNYVVSQPPAVAPVQTATPDPPPQPAPIRSQTPPSAMSAANNL